MDKERQGPTEGHGSQTRGKKASTWPGLGGMVRAGQEWEPGRCSLVGEDTGVTGDRDGRLVPYRGAQNKKMHYHDGVRVLTLEKGL